MATAAASNHHQTETFEQLFTRVLQPGFSPVEKAKMYGKLGSAFPHENLHIMTKLWEIALEAQNGQEASIKLAAFPKNGEATDTDLIMRVNKAVLEMKPEPINYKRLNHIAAPTLTILRNKDLPHRDFLAAIKQMARILAVEAAAALPQEKIIVETPCGKAEGVRLPEDVVLVSIWRSGNALEEPFMEQFPNARVSHIGMARDKQTAVASTYYENLDKVKMKEKDQIIILDPMLGTGGSLEQAIGLILKKGGRPEQILYVGIIASQEGFDHVRTRYPTVRYITTQIDSELNAKKYIVPGFGDCGDRIYLTAH